MNTKPEPIPCPHCGNGANSDVNDGLWSVACCTCTAGQVGGYYLEAKAVEAWNRRVVEPALENLKQAALDYGNAHWRTSANLEKLGTMAVLYARAHAEKGPK